jgi:membrane fusion protein (multidrug efflux system)
MGYRGVAGAGVLVLACVAVSSARGQAPPTAAKVDTQPLLLTPPDRYLVQPTLEPIRRVTLVAAADGIVRSQDAHEGSDVRANQEVAQLDKAEAIARLKIAQAEAKEQQAALAEVQSTIGGSDLKNSPKGKTTLAQAEARLEAAQARVELAQAALDRCTLRAPFAGRIAESFVSDGQYVNKGTVIAELVDVSSLRALVPLARAGTVVGGAVTVGVEGQPVTGKVQAVLPLSEGLAVVRELATPMASAWVVVPNAGGTLEPGQRVLSPALPTWPLANVPTHAVQNADGKKGAPAVQVIRNEYVTVVPVRVLGTPGPDRVQVSGALRPTDALIVNSSVPLQPGTLIRFGGSPAPLGTVEGTTPNPAVVGEPADLTPPRPASAGNVAMPRTRAPAAPAPASRPAAPTPKPAGSSVPF